MPSSQAEFGVAMPRSQSIGGFCALLLITAAAPQTAAAPVYRCISPAGEVAYTQFGCRDQDHRKPLEEGHRPVRAGTSALTEEEVAQLEQLEQDLRQTRQSRSRKRAAHRQAARRAYAQARRQCAQARAMLERIETTRRSGYTVQAARTLDQEERRWRETQRASC